MDRLNEYRASQAGRKTDPLLSDQKLIVTRAGWPQPNREMQSFWRSKGLGISWSFAGKAQIWNVLQIGDDMNQRTTGGGTSMD
jgi:hypothetical protein